MGVDDLVGERLGPLVGFQPAALVPGLEVGPGRDHGLEVFGGVAVLGVLGSEEVSGRPDLGDGLDSE